MKRVQQIILGEKIKSILKKQYGKQSFFSKYQELNPEKIDLVITWLTKNNANLSKTFLDNQFGINEIKVEGTKDVDIYIISLNGMQGYSVGHVATYHKKEFSREKFSDNHAERILSEMENAKNNHDDSRMDHKHDEKADAFNEELREIDAELNPEPTAGQVDNLAKVVETDGAKKVDDKNENIDPAQCIEKFKKTLNFIFSFQSSYEKKFELSKMTDIKELFTWGGFDGYYQTLHCKNKLFAFHLDAAIQGYVKGAGQFILREGSVIKVHSLIFLKHKKENDSSGAFCFAPNELATANEVKERLHRVSYMTKVPAVEKGIGCFIVTYKLSKVAMKINNIICGMGWRSMAKGKDLVVLPGYHEGTPFEFEGKTENLTASNEKLEVQKVVEPEVVISTAKTEEKGTNGHSVASLPPFCKFTGSKDEAFEKLQKLYDSPAFEWFSQGTKRKVVEVLQRWWQEKNPEEYARSIVDFLEVET